jgi:hypothetical protein
MMLNLFAFNNVDEYGKRRDAFVAGAGSRHGRSNCTHRSETRKLEMATQVFLYIIPQFAADMLASPDYRDISHKYREGSLVDDPILCLVDV